MYDPKKILIELNKLLKMCPFHQIILIMLGNFHSTIDDLHDKLSVILIPSDISIPILIQSVVLTDD